MWVWADWQQGGRPDHTYWPALSPLTDFLTASILSLSQKADLSLSPGPESVFLSVKAEQHQSSGSLQLSDLHQLVCAESGPPALWLQAQVSKPAVPLTATRGSTSDSVPEESMLKCLSAEINLFTAASCRSLIPSSQLYTAPSDELTTLFYLEADDFISSGGGEDECLGELLLWVTGSSFNLETPDNPSILRNIRPLSCHAWKQTSSIIQSVLHPFICHWALISATTKQKSATRRPSLMMQAPLQPISEKMSDRTELWVYSSTFGFTCIFALLASQFFCFTTAFLTFCSSSRCFVSDILQLFSWFHFLFCPKMLRTLKPQINATASIL